MAAVVESPPGVETLADLLDQLGGISPQRVRIRPPLGTATVDDLIEISRREGRLFELVDGVLVEKAMGYRESVLALALGEFLRRFVIPANLGIVSGADGLVRLFSSLVRIPDVAFVSWERLPEGRIPDEPAPQLAPNLATEILSESNTPREMQRKCGEYFGAGVELVWLVDPRARTVAVYTTPQDFTLLSEPDTLTGEPVLPGLALPLRELFAELDRVADK